MICDLCGKNHATEKCQMLLSHCPRTTIFEPEEEPHLAYKSLPSWAQVLKREDGKISIITLKRLPKFTRLGPLVAPQTSKLVSNDIFPLKVSHSSGSMAYFDLTTKQHCNWLSLIPQGSSNNRNLLVCQIRDQLFYVTDNVVEENMELRVWYAPFYLKKIVKELNFLRTRKDLEQILMEEDNASVSDSFLRIACKPKYRLPSTLERISVDKGSVVFSHKLCYDRESLINTAVSLVNDTSNSALDGLISAGGISCRYVNKEPLLAKGPDATRKMAKGSLLSSKEAVVPTIEMIDDGDTLGESEKVFTFTIHETVSYQSSSRGEHQSSGLEDNLSEDSSDYKDASRRRRKRKPYKHKVKPAGKDAVKQLPLRALGVSLPPPWSCRYCGETFSKPLLFAKHVKNHLLSAIGGRFKCDICGQSFDSLSSLKSHEAELHRLSDKSLSPSENKDESDVTVKHETLSDEEEEHGDIPDSGEDRKSSVRTVLSKIDISKGPHNCQLCPKKFKKAEYLLRHLKKHTGEYACQKCLKVFARREGLVKHTCPSHLEQQKSQKCSYCNRMFRNKSLLQQHYLKHEVSGGCKCSQCGHFFASIISLEKHVKNCLVVEKSISYKCAICNKEFDKQSLLARHARSHKKKQRCHICSKIYVNSTRLMEHVCHCRQVQQIMTVGKVKCEECGDIFTNTDEFTVHYQKHTHPYGCVECNQRFRSRVGYVIHVCELKLRCDMCSAVFKSVQNLNRHAAVHGPPPYTCMSCRRSYYRKSSLDRHSCSIEEETKMSQPKENTNFKCNVCGVILATRHSYNTHIRTAHGGKAGKIFSCDLCGKKFSRKDLLRQHAPVHAPPSHPCPQCKKLFKTPKSLEVHSRLHLGIKRFTCKYCNKKFHQKINLVRHERTHRPRGAVKCQDCGVQCLSTDDLKAHLLSHTIVQAEVSQKSQKLSDGSVIKKTADASASEMCELTEGIESSKRSPAHKLSQLQSMSKAVQGMHNEKIAKPLPHSMSSKQSEEPSLSKTKGASSLSQKSQICFPESTKKLLTSEESCVQSGIENTAPILLSQKIPRVLNVELLKESTSSEKELSTLITGKQVTRTTFYGDSNSFNPVIYDLSGNVAIANSSDLIGNDVSHIYHLNLDDDNCQVTIEKREEDFDLNSGDNFKDENFRSIPESSSNSLEGQGIPVVYDSKSVVVVANTQEDVNY